MKQKLETASQNERAMKRELKTMRQELDITSVKEKVLSIQEAGKRALNQEMDALTQNLDLLRQKLDMRPNEVQHEIHDEAKEAPDLTMGYVYSDSELRTVEICLSKEITLILKV
jgi:hypothetical protein